LPAEKNDFLPLSGFITL